MRYLLVILGVIPLGWWLASTVPPAESQTQPAPITYDVADCFPGRPPQRRATDGQATSLAQLAAPTERPESEYNRALPPMRCAVPRTDAEIAADAQAVLNTALAAVEPLERQPRLLGPYSPSAGQLRSLLTERAMQVHQFSDTGNEIWHVMECYCDSSRLGLRLGFIQILVMRQRRDIPGIQYHAMPYDEGISRLTQGAIRST